MRVILEEIPDKMAKYGFMSIIKEYLSFHTDSMSDIENKNETQAGQGTPVTPTPPAETSVSGEQNAASAANIAGSTPSVDSSVTTTATPASAEVVATTANSAPVANSGSGTNTGNGVQKPIIRTPMQKRGTRISPKVFAIGCIGFVVLLVAGIFAAGYAGIQNPSALASIGMNASQAKTLLLIVSGAFFGILFFVSFAFLGLNAYRLVRAKNTPKAKFIIGIIVSLLLLSISVGLGVFAITSIQKINTEEVYSKNLVVGYVGVFPGLDKKMELVEIEKPGITPIAPAQIYMKINSTFRLALATKLGVNSIVSMQLSCGNAEGRKPDQIVDAAGLLSTDGTNAKSDTFDLPCLYTKKGVYTLQLLYTYFDKTSQQTKSDKMEVGTINIPAEIILTNEGERLETNDSSTEMMAGDSPSRIVFDAKKVFTDYGLSENLIIWDVDGDGTDDANKENKAFFGNTYTDGKLYMVKYRLPGNPYYPLYYYSFPLRVLQSDVPICRITQENGDNGTIQFKGTWPDGGIDIQDMRFEVYNVSKEQVVQSVATSSPSFSYKFPDNDQYVVRLLYTTLERKKGFCESDPINANSANYNINSTIFIKTANDSQYKQLNGSGEIRLEDGKIIAEEAPFDIQVRIDGISPQPPKNASINILLNDQGLEAIKSNLFTTRVYGNKTQTLKVFIDDQKGNTATKSRDIVFNQDALKGKLLANKVTGTEPLSVQFDASTITATETDDEIVYFTWDFGDGKGAKNVTQAKATHTYSFNAGSGSGVYKPSVSVQTKKGYTKIFTLDTPISVTRRATNVSISMPSHPTQIVDVGDQVSFSMQTDGYVTNIAWDFGDDTTGTECEFRSCADTKHTFTTAGTYTVRVTIDYQGLPSATNTITVKVEE